MEVSTPFLRVSLPPLALVSGSLLSTVKTGEIPAGDGRGIERNRGYMMKVLERPGKSRVNMTISTPSMLRFLGIAGYRLLGIWLSGYRWVICYRIAQHR